MFRASQGSSVLSVIAFLGAGSVVAGSVVFEDVSATAGIEPSTPAGGMAVGVAAADFDDDGFVDLFVPNAAGFADQLYRNLGNGQFCEMADEAGVASLLEGRGALWLDYDGDGDLDLMVTREDPAAVYTLYRQYAPSLFEDVTQAAGMDVELSPKGQWLGQHRSGACAGDIDGDGYLDFCVTIWNGHSRLFRNQRDGTFIEITESSGLGTYLRNYWQPVMTDINGDGWLDIYLAVDFEPNQLWVNQKDGTFVEDAATVGLDNAMNDMGVALGDYDNDGDLDIYITNIYADSVPPEYNVLYRDDSYGETVSFTDVSLAGQVNNGGWGWGTTFVDVDRDGWLDIAETNGFPFRSFAVDPSRLFLNPGSSPFVFLDASSATGFNDTLLGSALVSFDYDRDGDPDLVQACMQGTTRLLANTPGESPPVHRYLTIRPRMLGPNSRAVGAIVRVRTGDLQMMRLITAGMSCMGQEPAEAFFGLGTAGAADTVTVEWPDGTETTLLVVPADQVLTIMHGGFGDLDADGDIDEADVAIFLLCFTGPGGGGIQYAEGCRAADLDADGDVDCGDYSVVEAAFLASSGYLPVLGLSEFLAVLLGSSHEAGHVCMADMNDDENVDGLDVGSYVAALVNP